MFSFRFCIHAAKQNHHVHVWFANPENVVTVVFILLPIFGREYLVNWETIHKNLHQPKETLQIFYKDLGFMWRVWTKDAQSWFEEEGSHGWKITISDDSLRIFFIFQSEIYYSFKKGFSHSIAHLKHSFSMPMTSSCWFLRLDIWMMKSSATLSMLVQYSETSFILSIFFEAALRYLCHSGPRLYY